MAQCRVYQFRVAHREAVAEEVIVDQRGVSVRIVCSKCCWVTLVENEAGDGFTCVKCGQAVSLDAALTALEEAVAAVREMRGEGG